MLFRVSASHRLIFKLKIILLKERKAKNERLKETKKKIKRAEKQNILTTTPKRLGSPSLELHKYA